jgi:glycosyltransferase involved in cell wall biosynthesis
MFGFYLSDQRHPNIVCDVCDSPALFLMSMKGLARSRREILSFYYSYFHNWRWERKYLSGCGRLIVISERDRLWLSKSITRRKIHVLTNGIDSGQFNPRLAQPGLDKDLIVFTGVMDYPPNHDAMRYCIKEIWPLIKNKLPGAKLRIVGRRPLSELRQMAGEAADVEVAGEVEDIQLAVRGASIYLCPMRIGAGMKNKVLEALSMGIPVVATKEAWSGIEFEHGKTGLIAEGPEETAARCVELSTNAFLRQTLSQAGRALVEAKYSWVSRSKELSELLLLKV